MSEKRIDRVMRIRRRWVHLSYYDIMFSVSLLKLDNADLEAIENLLEKLEAK